MKNSKKIQTPTSSKKGRTYARKMAARMWMSVLTLFFIVMLVGFCQDTTVHELLFGAGGSISLASMMAIGDISDVSDRDTHGSNIAYQVHLINVAQIDNSVPFPSKNANREVGQIPMKTGEYMTFFEAHDIPTFNSTGEKGDITTSGENNMVIVMGGMRDQLLNFIEQYAGSKFVLLFREVGATQWNIIGTYDRPMILTSYDAKHDKDGRYVTFTFKRTSIDQYCHYVGSITRSPATSHTAGATTLTISPSSNCYSIPDGSAATYAINGIAGLTASDKGRNITIEGAGGAKAATIVDGATFILEDGATFTAKAGSRITFRVLDATTLVEVSGTRIQTA